MTGGDEFGDLSTKGEAVLSTINLLRILIMSQSAVAPEKMRVNVKLAASMLVCFSANRQSREFPANAIIASSVRVKIRVGFTAFSREVQLRGELIAGFSQ